jgi:hypothetical protein
MSDVASVSTDERSAIDSLSDELVATVETSQDKTAARYIQPTTLEQHECYCRAYQYCF